MSKFLRRGIVSVVAAAAVSVASLFGACTMKSKHPKANLTIEFNDNTYKIEYTLYRNMYPQTVQHFIELADEGFYDNTVIHNYTSSDWFTGGYSYDDDKSLKYDAAYSGNALAEYLTEHSKENEYYALAGSLSKSVYKQLSYDEKNNETVKDEDALPTLIGEFTNNDHRIDNGALNAEFGVLKTYYYDKGNTNQKVAIKNSSGQILEHDYRYNCATSLFAIQTGTSSSYTSTNYAIFARLKDSGANKALNALLTDIEDYIADNLTGTNVNFTRSVTVNVDNADNFADEGGQSIETTFSLTHKPIIIKSVKVTKY